GKSHGKGHGASGAGYRYQGAGTSSDPCTLIVVSASEIKFVCTGAGVTLVPPFAGDSGIILTVGADTRYCAEFGGKTLRNDDRQLRRKNAPAPDACADGGASSTSSSSTSSTSTSSTSSSSIGPTPTTSSTSIPQTT